MDTVLTTVPAHFDGQQIRLDVKVDLKPDTRLLVTILDEESSDQLLVQDAIKISESAFARVWNNPEDAAYDQL